MRLALVVLVLGATWVAPGLAAAAEAVADPGWGPLVVQESAAPGPTQAVTPASCATASLALGWWTAQEARVEAIRTRHPELAQLWDTVRLQLQQRQDAAAGGHPTCELLEQLLLAVETPGVPDSAALHVRAAARLAALGLPDEVVRPARPALAAVGRSVGAAMEDAVKATPITAQRVDALQRVVALYADAGLPGAQARVALWSEAEQNAWAIDAGIARRHLDEIARTATNGPLGMAGFLGRFPSLARDLEVDRRAMEAHGASTHVAVIDSRVASMQVLQARALEDSIVLTLVVVAAAVAASLLLRLGLRSFEADLTDVELALSGVPP